MEGDSQAYQLVMILVGAVAGLVSLAQLASVEPLTSLPKVLSPVLGILALLFLYMGFKDVKP